MYYKKFFNNFLILFNIFYIYSIFDFLCSTYCFHSGGTMLDEIRNILFQDHAVPGEAAGMVSKLIFCGIGNSECYHEMSTVCHETQHEKIIGLAIRIASIMLILWINDKNLKEIENKIFKNLESKRIRVEFDNQRNSRFELFEQQILLKESIESLVRKYSIGKEKKINNNEITLKNHITDVKKYDSTYVCPITKKLMKCPVVAYDKCLHEKEAKIKYLMHCDGVKNSLKIVIFPPHSPNTLTFSKWCFIDQNDDDSDDDYFARAYEQLILHLNLLTKSALIFSGANSRVNDVDVNVKYVELKYSIYNSDGGKYNTIVMDMSSNLQNTVKTSAASASRFDKYSLDSQVKNYANLKAYFQNGDNQDICYLFVEYKHYFLIENNGICCAQWHSQWSNNSVDWETQFNCLKADACDERAILNNDKISLRFGLLKLFYRKRITILAKEKELEVPQIGEDSLKSLERLFNHLINSMKSEGYNKGTQIFDNVSNEQISLLNMRDIDSSYKAMKDVLIGVRPFDINEMVQLYGEAEETTKQVSNENIILLLGHTGTGKSTTIHFLAGSHLKKHKIIN